MNHPYLMIIIAVYSLIVGANAWYTYKYADRWGKKEPRCNGLNQSPIIVNPLYLYSFGTESTIKFLGYKKKPKSMTLKNTGRTVEITGEWPEEPPKMTSGSLESQYIFHKLSFYWSQKDKEGSQHKIFDNNLRRPVGYDMEAVLSFYNEKENSYEEAVNQPNGLVHVSVFLNVKTTTNLNQAFYHLDKDILKKVQSIDATVDIKPLSLSDMYLSTKYKTYLSYNGSLMSPPCLETVTWFLKSHELNLRLEQLQLFRTIKLAGWDYENVRPIQPLNSRRVYIITDKT